MIIDKEYRVWDNVDCMSMFTLEDVMHHKIVFTSDCPVMQSMNHPDCDGNKLFEGDVVCARRQRDWISGAGRPNTPEWQPYDEYRLCEFKHTPDGVSFILPLESRYNERGNPAKWRLVGNIYENPELLDKITIA